VAAAAARMADTAAGAGWRAPEVGAAAAAGGTPREITLTGPLYLEGGEFVGVVRGVVHEEQQALVMQAGAGRRS
jgi:hypothetical protein